jgi:hypothetical protein
MEVDCEDIPSLSVVDAGATGTTDDSCTSSRRGPDTFTGIVSWALQSLNQLRETALACYANMKHRTEEGLMVTTHYSGFQCYNNEGTHDGPAG